MQEYGCNGTQDWQGYAQRTHCLLIAKYGRAHVWLHVAVLESRKYRYAHEVQLLTDVIQVRQLEMQGWHCCVEVTKIVGTGHIE